MIPVIALCQINRNPTGRMEATGRYDAQGNMIMRSAGDKIMPETIFELDEGTELDEFRALSAVRDLTEEERALWERGRGK